MQKHNKYLVWTIWVATIGFIGAGSVGWGSLSFGSKAKSVAKVGDIEISQQRLNQAYTNLYSRYNQLFQGKFDDKKAKELGLVQQAFASLETQAKLLNFAKENGIIVTDKEVAKQIEQIKIFQTNGVFDKKAYYAYLRSQHMKNKVFEASLKDDLIVQKVLSLLSIKPLDFEVDAISSSMNIADKITYKVLSTNDINISLEDNKLEQYWQEHRKQYMTDKIYQLSIVWKETTNIKSTEEELKKYYNENSFNFTDSNGKLLNFEDVKEQVQQALALKKLKKDAQLTYISLKKGKISEPKAENFVINDPKFDKAIWDELQTKEKGNILKPKIVDNKYAIIKIVDIKQPRIKTYTEAKDSVVQEYLKITKQKALKEKADSMVKELQNYNPMTTEFITVESQKALTALNLQENMDFLQKLFISNKEKGIISLSDKKVVVYNIVNQKLNVADQNKTDILKQTISQIKTDIYQNNLINQLNAKYKTQLYRKGLTK